MRLRDAEIVKFRVRVGCGRGRGNWSGTDAVGTSVGGYGRGEGNAIGLMATVHLCDELWAMAWSIGGSTWWCCVFEAECGSLVAWLVDGGRAFLKLAQWDFNNFIPVSTCVYEVYGRGKPHGTSRYGRPMTRTWTLIVRKLNLRPRPRPVVRTGLKQPEATIK